MKFLVFMAVIIGLIYFFRQNKKRANNKATHRENNPKTISMVQCNHCGVHLPENEAIVRNGKVWCSSEHERLGKS